MYCWEKYILNFFSKNLSMITFKDYWYTFIHNVIIIIPFTEVTAQSRNIAPSYTVPVLAYTVLFP